VTTLVLNQLFGTSVEVLRERELKRILGQLAQDMRGGRPAAQLARFRERIVELLDKTAHERAKPTAEAAVTEAALRRLLDVLILLEAVVPDRPIVQGWAGTLDEIAALVGPRPAVGQVTPVRTPQGGSPASPADLAIEAAIAALRRVLEQREVEISKPKAGAPQLLVKDATTNPAHWQFALKVTFAVMLSYAIYSLLDWSGMRTAIVTCFFVALGSVGETVHKLTLRLSGALIGGALAALCIVFVLPYCTDIGQLCLIIAIVSTAAGWIATSSEALSYAGLQMAFAFFLGMLQDYAPATDLTVLRDRVAGIILGNVIMTIVFSTLWPESAASRVRSTAAQALRAIAALVGSPSDTAAKREKAARALVLAEHFRILRGFELHLVPGHVPAHRMGSPLRDLALLESRVFVTSSESSAYREEDRKALGNWADEAASAAESNSPWPTPPVLAPGASEPVRDVVAAASQVILSAQAARSDRDRTTARAN
jgi:multidrug resistance protein MdtO